MNNRVVYYKAGNTHNIVFLPELFEISDVVNLYINIRIHNGDFFASTYKLGTHTAGKRNKDLDFYILVDFFD